MPLPSHLKPLEQWNGSSFEELKRQRQNERINADAIKRLKHNQLPIKLYGNRVLLIIEQYGDGVKVEVYEVLKITGKLLAYQPALFSGRVDMPTRIELPVQQWGAFQLLIGKFFPEFSEEVRWLLLKTLKGWNEEVKRKQRNASLLDGWTVNQHIETVNVNTGARVIITDDDVPF